MLKLSRSALIFGLIVVVGVILIGGIAERPAYTDAYYHFNAAYKLVSGEGLTDEYLWTYIGAPDSLPAPSHLYWMPFTSLLAAAGMGLFGISFDAAQLPLLVMLAGTVFTGYWLGGYLGNGRRHAWVAGLLVLFSGFFTHLWGQIDTFAPYALVGSLALVFMARGATGNGFKYWFFAGIFAGLGHLTRADGLLLLLVAGGVLLWPWDWFTVTINHRARLMAIVSLMIGYLLVMTPWFARNTAEIGTILPTGGTQSIWFTEYDDLFSYPPDASPDTLFADGTDAFIDSRLLALSNNLQHFIAEQGWIVLWPLMLIGLWKRRHDVRLRAFWLFAAGIHLAMTFVFPFPGYRGGLFHASSALLPWWAVLVAVGLDDAVDWIAMRRRTWNAGIAKFVFSVAMVLLAFVLSASIGMGNFVKSGTPAWYDELIKAIPEGSRVMINDPAGLYYHTGLGGAVIPNESPDVIPEIARKYSIGYLLVEGVNDAGRIAAVPLEFAFDANSPPEYLKPIPLNSKGIRLYEIAF